MKVKLLYLAASTEIAEVARVPIESGTPRLDM